MSFSAPDYVAHASDGVFVLTQSVSADAPTLVSRTPSSGAMGETITFVVTNAGAAQGNGAVLMGTEAMDIISWADTEIVAQIPYGLVPASYNVTLLNNSGYAVTQASWITIPSTSSDDLSYQASWQYAMEESQGGGWSENTGSNFVFPYRNVPPITVYDEQLQPHVIIIDRVDRQAFDITTRIGPPNGSLEVTYKDKVAYDGSGGTFIAPTAMFPEERGSSEHFFMGAMEHYFGFRPISEEKRDESGYDANGFPTGTKMTVEIFADGERITADVSMSKITIPGHMIKFDRYIRGKSRITTKISMNRAELLLTSRQIYYLIDDIPAAPDNMIQNYQVYQRTLASLALWATMRLGTLVNRTTGIAIGADVTASTDPLSRSNGFSFDAAITLGTATLTSGSVLFWGKNIDSLTIGGVAVSLTSYDTLSGWTLYYATGVTKTGSVILTPSGTGEAFDFRLITSSVVAADEVAYYYDDANANDGNACIPKL